MNENVEISLSSNLDTKGLDLLRKALNDQRNELNAVARETDKADIKYKQLKATVSELNRLMKLSDTELKQYASSLIPIEKNIDKVNNAKGRMLTNTDKLTKSFSSLKTNVGSYSTTIVNLSSDIAQGDKSIMESVGTLGLYAGGWAAVASAVYLATQNIVEYLNKDSLVIKNLESNIPKTGDILNGTDGSLRQYEKKRTGLFFDYNIGPQYDNSNQQYNPTRDSMPGTFDAERLQNLLNGKTKLGGKTAKETKVELTEIEKLQQDLIKLESEKLNYISLYGEQAGIVLETLKKIKDTQEKIKYLTSGKNIYDTSGITLPEKKLPLFSAEDIRQSQYQAESDYINSLDGSKYKDTNNTLEDIQTGYSLIAQSMSLLNVGTDTFVGKLMAVFNFANSALSIGSSIVSFITKIIPGLGSMPSMSGGSMSLDTNRMINQSVSMNASPVNIYMSSNVSQKYFKAQIESYNNMKQYTKI